MKIIVSANRRGGAGKTVTTFAIGAGLARKGYKVLFIDLDSQTNLTYDLAADKNKYNAMDMLTGKVPAELAIQKLENWDAIPASPDLDAAPLIINGNGKEYRLRDALRPVSGKYDFCLIDTPPALNIITVNALTAATGVIMAVEPEIHSLQGVALLYDMIRQVKRNSNRDLKIYGIVITKYKGRECLSKDMQTNLEGIADRLDTKVFNTPIRDCAAVRQAEYRQMDIYSYNKRSNAAKDYTALLNELLEDMKGND